jgi:hypothetical protein
MTIFCEQSIEMWPSTFTALSHVVAVQEELRRKFRDVFAILDFEFGFNSLRESHGVA